MEQTQKLNKLPNLFVLGIIILCVIPLLLNLFSFDFGSVRTSLGIKDLLDVPANQFMELLFTQFQGVFVHIILEWSSISLAFLTAILAFIIFRITNNIALPIIGMALFCSGVMDTFHTLAASRLITAVAENEQFIPYTWALSRIFNVVIIIVGILIYNYISRNSKINPGNRSETNYVWFVVLFIGILSYMVIHYSAVSENLPETMFPDSLIRRPYDVVPLVLFIVAGTLIFPRFYKKEQSVFAYALWVSMIPQIATELYMAFGSGALYDNNFNIAHFLKISAFAVPFVGLSYDYIFVYKLQQSKQAQLDKSLSDILSNTPIGDLDTKKKYLLENTARSIMAETAGMGFLNVHRTEIQCDHKFVLSENKHYQRMDYGLDISEAAIKFMEAKRYIIESNIKDHPVFKDLINIAFIDKSTASILVVPIKYDNKFSGIFIFGRKEITDWSTNEINFAISIGIHYSKLNEEYHRKLNEKKLIESEKKLIEKSKHLSWLNSGSQMLFESENNEQIYKIICDQLRDLTECIVCNISLLISDNKFQLSAVSGDKETLKKIHEITRMDNVFSFESAIYEKLCRNEILINDNMDADINILSVDNENKNRMFSEIGVTFGYSFPIIYSDKLLGVTFLGSDRIISQSYISTIESFLKQVSITIQRNNSEKFLRESEQDYKYLFDTAPVMRINTYYKNNNPIIKECNNMFLDVLGYKKEEVINHQLVDFYSQTSIKGMLDYGYKEALKGKFTEKRQLKKKDGSLISTIIQAFAVTGVRRGIDVMASYTDITELEKQRQTLENREQELTWLYGSMTQISNLTKNHVLYENIISSVLDLSSALLAVFASFDGDKFNVTHFKSDPQVLRNVERIAKVKYDEISVRFNPKLVKLLSKGKSLIFDDTFGGMGESKIKFLIEMIKVLRIEEMHVFPLVHEEQLIGICFLATHKSQLLSHNTVNSINSLFNQASIILQRNIYQEETTKISQELLQFIDTANAPIFGIDTHGLINEWNQTAERITGFTKKNAIGKNLVEDFITKDFQTSVKEVFDNALEGKETANFEFPLFTKKGGRVLILLNASTRRDVDANIIGVMGVGQDITERVRIEKEVVKERNRFNTLFENSSIPFAVLHSEKGFLYVNKATVKLFGCRSKQEVIKMGPERFSPEYQFNNELTVDRVKKNIDEAFKKGAVNFDWIHTTLNGKEIICNVNLNVIELDGEKVLQTAMLDVSSERETERQIYELNMNLEEKVEKRTKELEIANKRLKKAESDIRASLAKEKELGELKSKFVSMASHEFRTPLTAILSASDIIKRYQDRMTKTEVIGKIDKIQTEIKSLTDILEDFLIIGKSEVGKVEFEAEKMNFKSFCDDFINEIKDTTELDHNIDYVFENPEVADLDPRLLKHIISNLLNNAIKYSAAGSKIEFHVSAKNGLIKMQFNDNGIGIPEDDLKNIFETFHRASNVGSISGTGLGMAIVKKSVDLHNGQITINSTEGVGTKIEVTIPYTSLKS